MLVRLLLSGEVEIARQLTTKAVPVWWKVGMPLSLEPPKAFVDAATAAAALTYTPGQAASSKGGEAVHDPDGEVDEVAE
eukprot:2561419-Amphidinium_carterae.1